MIQDPGDVVMTPFMGVGSEVYGAIINGRKGVGIELKSSYFKQAVRNIASAKFGISDVVEDETLFSDVDDEESDETDTA